MGIAERYNKNEGTSFTFDIPDTHEFINLNQLYQMNGSKQQYPIHLFFFTTGKFGESPVIATDNYLVNIPKHMLETMKEMRTDDELIEAVNNTQVGFTIYEYNNEKYNTVNYSINFVDL